MASSYFKLKIIQRKRIARKKKEAEIKAQRMFNKTQSNSPLAVPKCRACLRDGNIPIYGDECSPDISESVQIFGDIEISKHDDYPKHLCNTCYSLLLNAISFRKSSKETDALLHQKYKNVLYDTDSRNCGSRGGDFHDLLDHSETYRRCCKLCKLTFNNSDEYIAHKNSKQHRNVRIQCTICFGLLTPQLYQRHLARHQSATHLICDVCGKMYRKDNLLRHLQLHSFELPFQCQMCPYRGRFLESLKIHMRSHTGDKPFSCDKCQLRFLTRSNLNRHLLTHNKDRPFKCVECGRGFYTKRDLDVHFKSDHAGIKDFSCRTCGNKYGNRKALMRHELRVHKRDKMAKGRMPLYLQADYIKTNEVS